MNNLSFNIKVMNQKEVGNEYPTVTIVIQEFRSHPMKVKVPLNTYAFNSMQTKRTFSADTVS